MFGTNRESCSIIAARTECLVFDADYRKAPEHPFPAAIQDAEDIIFYLIANPDEYDPSNIFLSGFSAGGSIALVTASTLGPDRIKGVIGFYPAVDLTKQHTAPEQRMLAGVTVSVFLLFSEILPVPRTYHPVNLVTTHAYQSPMPRPRSFLNISIWFAGTRMRGMIP
jgi:acetyl esterase/lipase